LKQRANMITTMVLHSSDEVLEIMYTAASFFVTRVFHLCKTRSVMLKPDRNGNR